MSSRVLPTTVLGIALAGALMSPAPGRAADQLRPGQSHVVTAGEDVDLFAPALSHSGRYLAFHAVPRDGAGQSRLVRADLATGRWVVLNRSITGAVAEGGFSLPPVISADGSRVSFTSDADDLVPADDNDRADAFVRDVPRVVTRLASRSTTGGASDGQTGMESLSRSGRYVVFTSTGTDLVPGSRTPNYDVFRHDLATGRTIQVTVRPDGRPSRGPGSVSADVSADGRLVAFTSANLDVTRVDGDGSEADLFIRDLRREHTRWLSRGWPAGADPSGVVVSPDGRWVTTRWADASLHLTHVPTGVTSTIAADAYATTGSFSALGNRLVFVSGGAPHVLDLTTGTATPVGVPPGGFVSFAAISGDGRVVAFDWTVDDGGSSRIHLVRL